MGGDDIAPGDELAARRARLKQMKQKMETSHSTA
jgi:hypothetical protein